MSMSHPQIGSPPRFAAKIGQQNSAATSAGAWAMVLLLALLPAPLGSVNPLYWSAAGVVVGLIGVWTFLTSGQLTDWARTSDLKVLGGLFSALLCFLVIQVLPVIPTSATTVAGYTFNLAQISVVPGQTILMIVSMATLAATFLLMARFGGNEQRRERIYFVLLSVITAYGVYGMFALQTGDHILGLHKWAYEGSVTGTFVNRNSFATFLAFGAAIAAGLIVGQLHRRAGRDRRDGKVPYNTSNIVVLSVFYLLLLGALFLTNSRMGLFVALLATLLAAIIGARAIGLAKAIILPGLAFIIVLIGAVVFYGAGTLERLQGVETDVEIRGALYKQVWDLIWQRPLTGFGGGTFEYAFQLVRQEPVTVALVWDRAHSTYLGLWADLGLLAGSIPVLICGYIGWRLLGMRVTGDRSLAAQVIGLSVLLIGAVHSTVDFSLEIFAVAMMFVALVGLAFGGYMRTSRSIGR